MALATAFAKLDYCQYFNEREKYKAEFLKQSKYKSFFHYIVAQHRLALERASRPCKPNLRDIEWLRTYFATELLISTFDGCGESMFAFSPPRLLTGRYEWYEWKGSGSRNLSL